MPYIKPEQRLVLDKLIKTLSSHCDSTGEMNYVITKFVHTKMEERRFMPRCGPLKGVWVDALFAKDLPKGFNLMILIN